MSYQQPLDQGVIASFKLQYRRLWIEYMLWQYEANKDPNKTVNLLKAVQWTRKAWDEVEASTIRKCWWRSTIFKKPVDEIQDYSNQQDQVSYTKLQAQINRLPNLVNPLTVNKYI